MIDNSIKSINRHCQSNEESKEKKEQNNKKKEEEKRFKSRKENIIKRHTFTCNERSTRE